MRVPTSCTKAVSAQAWQQLSCVPLYHVCILIRATCCYMSTLHWETRIRNGWTWKMAGIAMVPISQDSVNGPGANLVKLNEEASFNEECWKWLLQQFFFS